MDRRSGRSYAQDLRDRVLAAVDGGMAVRQVAATFRVSVAYIYKALIRRRQTGDSGISPNRGRPPRKLSPAQELALAAHIRSRPGITLAQAQASSAGHAEATLGADRRGPEAVARKAAVWSSPGFVDRYGLADS